MLGVCDVNVYLCMVWGSVAMCSNARCAMVMVVAAAAVGAEQSLEVRHKRHVPKTAEDELQ